MVAVARQFDLAFPATQFVLVLGNEDSDCGDYAVATNSAFLRAVARAWSPLVNRNGAAPAFEKTFARDGYYLATLPLPRLRAVVLNDVYWSPRYRSACGGSANPSLQMLRDLDGALPVGGPGHAWVFAHIPPGIDAFSTAQISHGLLAVPLLKQRAKDRFVSLVADPSRHVTMVVTGHTHRFAFRAIGTGPSAIPILLAPAISPIFGNAPSFLSASVSAGGEVETLNEWSLLHGSWHVIGGLDSLQMHGLTGAGVIDLQHRLLRDAGVRSTYARLYGGGTPSEINPTNSRVYWCVMTALTTSAFRDCTAEGGIGIITNKGLRVTAALVLLLAFAVTGALVALRFVRRRSEQPTPRSG
ncbi:MAG: hypothetical protein IAI50_10230 [Candidatus Eremiobacteraeota bacterium]|nr:hypothetical protein [Candidatus Eremiobacteraeota bacterium]